jgi:hypothetical protein
MLFILQKSVLFINPREDFMAPTFILFIIYEIHAQRFPIGGLFMASDSFLTAGLGTGEAIGAA